MCYVCIIPYFTRSRVPSHISVATSVGNKSIGSMWRERFGLFSNDEDHPSFGLFMFSLPLFSLPLSFLLVSFLVLVLSFLVALISPSEGPLDFKAFLVRTWR